MAGVTPFIPASAMAREAVTRRDFLQQLAPGALAAGLALGSRATAAGGHPPEAEALDLVHLSRTAMGCRFEIVLPEPGAAAVAAAREALEVASRLEEQLSIFRPESELSRLNQAASDGLVPVEAGLFDLLGRARDWSERTRGAFDPAAGPLLALWRQAAREQAPPDPARVAALLPAVGMRHLELAAERMAVRFRRPGVALDLASVGKGYAVDCMVTALREQGVTTALVHAGHSSIFALGAPGVGEGWLVEVTDPRPGCPPLARLWLRDRGLSTSSARYQSFQAQGTSYGHLVDPRTGWPAQGTLSVSALAPGAAEAEALSTALFVLGEGEETGQMVAGWPGAAALALWPQGEGSRLEAIGSYFDWEAMGELNQST